MKKIIKSAIHLAALFTFTVAGAQTENQKNSPSISFHLLDTYVDGEILYKDGNEETVKIYYQNPAKLKDPDEPIIYKKHGKMLEINKDRLESFTIEDNEWKKVEHDVDPEYGIVKIDGHLKYYSVFQIPVARVAGDYKELEYIKKVGEDPIAAGSLLFGYKKKMSKVVADYPELAKKIKNKEKGYRGFLTAEKAIKEYNEWYARNNPEDKESELSSKSKASETVSMDAKPSKAMRDLGVPVKLFGVWTEGDKTFKIFPNGHVVFISAGSFSTKTKWKIDTFDEENGFVAGELVEYYSGNTNVTENYDGHIGFFNYTELGNSSIKIDYMGHGVVSRDKINDVKKSREDTKYLGDTYEKKE